MLLLISLFLPVGFVLFNFISSCSLLYYFLPLLRAWSLLLSSFPESWEGNMGGELSSEYLLLCVSFSVTSQLPSTNMDVSHFTGSVKCLRNLLRPGRFRYTLFSCQELGNFPFIFLLIFSMKPVQTGLKPNTRPPPPWWKVVWGKVLDLFCQDKTIMTAIF